MPQLQQYRLRLTEGTQLLVDHDALGVWINDEKAMVQASGSQRWRLLRQFLADEQERKAAAPPRRPRLAKGESARADRVLPPEYGGDETFGPELSEVGAPWEWAVPGSVPPPPRPESEIVEPELPDFEFPNDDLLTLDDLVAPMEPPARPAASERRETATVETPKAPEAADAARPQGESIAPEDMLAHVAERAIASVQVLAEEMSVTPRVAAEWPGRSEAAALPPAEEPVEAVVWGDGVLGWFCGTVADWSDRIADWIDHGRNTAIAWRERIDGWRSRRPR